MLLALLLSLSACSSETDVSTTSTVDSGATVDSDATVDSATGEVEDAICSQHQFCDAVQDCFSIMGDDMCEKYYVDDFGICGDATPAQLESYHACICDCWLGDHDNSCFSMGSCSDWCGQTEC
jgi:hypothetical protein